MVNVLVTGGNGFVGRNLVKELSKRKRIKVTVFDRSIGNNPNVKYINGNITNTKAVANAVKGQDYVYHLAAIIDEKKPKEQIFDVNVGGTVSILEACRKEKVKRLVYLSTAGVIRDSNNIQDEKSLYGPITNYEKSKTLAEKTVIEYYKRHKIPVIILRPALLYGPNTYWNIILNEALKNFPVIGTGENKWHMLYIRNLIPLLIKARTKGKNGRIYLVADDEALTYEDMYKIIREELEINKEPIHIPVWFAKFIAFLYKTTGNKSIVSRSHIDRLIKNKWYKITKAKRELSYKPKYNFKEGIEETIKYFRDEGTLRR